MRSLGVMLLFLALSPWLHAESPGRKLWLASVGALVAGNALDLASSHGGIEANPVMRAHATVLKCGAVGAVVLVEWLVLRHSSKKELSVVNFSIGGAMTAVSVRNWRVK